MATKNIRSKARVRALGEVFTAEREVNAMLNLLPESTFQEAGATFLEPACGNGNFVIKILERKLQYLDEREPVIDALRRLSSIYGMDIAEDNVVECRARVLAGLVERVPLEGFYLDAAVWVLEMNILCGDFLAEGTGRFKPHSWPTAAAAA